MAKAAVAKVRPLDAAEQDAVLRSRLSHPLSHRPLTQLRNRLLPVVTAIAFDKAASASASEQDEGTAVGDNKRALAALSVLPDLQSYLVALHRSQLASTASSSSQLTAYQEQLDEIQQEQKACRERIAGLKRDLEGVRRRRREKVEYGRVVEGVEAWFKSGAASSAGEIEESLSTLVSHLTASFLYKPLKKEDSEPATQEGTSSNSSHTQTLSTLHAKLDAMLTLAREVREIVGWKPGTGGSSLVAGGAAASNSRSIGNGDNAPADRPSMTSHRTMSGIVGSTQAALNPAARPFEPHSAASSRGNTPMSGIGSGSGNKRDRRSLLAAGGASSAPSPGASSVLTDLGSELEEGEEVSEGAPFPSSKRRRANGGGAGAAANKAEEGEADEEEGSIAPQAAASGRESNAAAGTTSASATSRAAGGSTRNGPLQRNASSRNAASASGSRGGAFSAPERSRRPGRGR